MGAAFEILDVDVDPQNWTAIVAPFSCNNVAIRNTLSVDLRIRTDLSKPGEDLISPNVQEGVVAPYPALRFGGMRARTRTGSWKARRWRIYEAPPAAEQ